MPEFKLEWSKSKPQDKQRRSIFYAKGIYNKNVKITNWEQYLEAFPHDNDPYCPGSMNYFLSHYNKFGNESEDDRYQTITHIMLNQIKEKKDISECQLPKHMINFRSCKNVCDKNNKKAVISSKTCAPEYLTTMQDSYTVPHPYVAQGFRLPTVPFLKYRKFKTEQPNVSENMFFDEEFEDNTGLLQKYKSSRWTSYNPMTGKNSDGSDA